MLHINTETSCLLLVADAWRRVQLREPDTVLTERWSSAQSLHISPYLVLIGQSVLLAAQQQETHCVTIILRHMLFADFLFPPASVCSTQGQTRSKTCSVLNPRDDVTSVRRLSHSDFRSKKAPGIEPICVLPAGLSESWKTGADDDKPVKVTTTSPPAVTLSLFYRS